MSSFQILNAQPRLPILANIPHSSCFIPAECRDQFVLSNDELRAEHAAIVDWFTDELYAPISELGGCALIAKASRLLVDTERFAEDEREVMAARGVGVIYRNTTRLAQLRRSLTNAERTQLLATYYTPYHNTMSSLVDDMLARFGRCIILDCHSFPEQALPYELSADALRPDICLGTDRAHSPEPLMERFERISRDRGWSVARDTPFAGTIVPLARYSDPRVHSVMLEVNRRLYMNEANTQRTEGLLELQSWVREIVRECVDWLASESNVALTD